MTDKLNLFDFLKSISETKVDYSELDNFEKIYPAFMVNRFLAASHDTLFFANIISQFSQLPNKLQYLFLLKGINKKKRYFQYTGKGKNNKSEELDSVIKYYACNKEQGIKFMELLNKEQLKLITEIYDDKVKKTMKGKKK